MRGMKLPQFSIRLLLLLTAILAITFGGIIGWVRVESRTAPIDLKFIAATIGMTAPLWMPLVFLAYAAGRRAISVWLVVALGMSVAAAIGLKYLALLWIFT
jgi:hypothetical protein